ncbi:MAG: intermembrane transport protein PqiB [Acetobacteraceae bacterium]
MNTDRLKAIVKPARWPGWIWAVPIAALALVVYLGVRELSRSGTEVIVTFPAGPAIKAGSTQVKYHDMVVGAVDSVTLGDSLERIRVVLRLQSQMEGHLGKGTRFWIAGESPSLTNLSSLTAVVSGPYIGIEPHSGDKQDHYEGLSRRPPTAYDTKGTHFVLTTPRLGNLSRGSAVFHRGLTVGEVQDTALAPDNRHFRIDVFVNAPFDQLVHAGSRFWDAGAVRVAMTASGPELRLQSLPAIVRGAVAFRTPDGSAAGSQAAPGAEFTLYDNRDQAEAAPDGTTVRYRVVFPTAEAGVVAERAPVTLEGKRIGSVTAARLEYDPNLGQLRTVTTLALQPGRIALAKGAEWGSRPKAQLDAMLRTLIGEGLRAQISRSVPVVGGKEVQLSFVPGAPTAALGEGDVPTIPTGPTSGIDGILSSVGDVAGKVASLPLQQIAAGLRKTVENLARISGSPQIERSLTNLDQALAHVEEITQTAQGEVGPILTQIRRAAQEARSAASGLQDITSGNALTRHPPGTAGLGETLYEVSRMARSLRELANYLDRHPEALLRGRGEPR